MKRLQTGQQTVKAFLCFAVTAFGTSLFIASLTWNVTPAITYYVAHEDLIVHRRHDGATFEVRRLFFGNACIGNGAECVFAFLYHIGWYVRSLLNTVPIGRSHSVFRPCLTDLMEQSLVVFPLRRLSQRTGHMFRGSTFLKLISGSWGYDVRLSHRQTDGLWFFLVGKRSRSRNL